MHLGIWVIEPNQAVEAIATATSHSCESCRSGPGIPSQLKEQPVKAFSGTFLILVLFFSIVDLLQACTAAHSLCLGYFF